MLIYQRGGCDTPWGFGVKIKHIKIFGVSLITLSSLDKRDCVSHDTHGIINSDLLDPLHYYTILFEGQKLIRHQLCNVGEKNTRISVKQASSWLDLQVSQNAFATASPGETVESSNCLRKMN